MIDYLVNAETGDIDLSSNDLQFTPDSITSLRQRLELRYNTWRDEWAYNTTFGTPYRQRLLVAGVTQEQIDAEFIAQANLEPDVTSVRNLNSSINTSTRSYRLQSLDVFTNNEVQNLSVMNTEATEFKYPEPPTLTNVVVCAQPSELYVDDGYVDEGYVATTQQDTEAGCILRANTLYVFDGYVDPDYVDTEIN